MNHDKLYLIKEALRELELALLGARENSRKHIDAAIEHLAEFEKIYRKI